MVGWEGRVMHDDDVVRSLPLQDWWQIRFIAWASAGLMSAESLAR